MRQRLTLVFVILAAASAVPLLVTQRLPMADLPEHAAQVALLRHYTDPCQQFASIFELNFATPYLLATLVAWAFSLAMPVSTAMKLTVWLTIVLLPAALCRLLRVTGGDAYWGLAGFALAYGFSFYWGFLNFSLAMGLAVLYLEALYGRKRRAAFLLALLLLTAHALMLLFCALVTLVVGVVDRSWRRVAPVLPPLLLLGAWVLYMRAVEPAVQRALVWQPGLYRVWQWPSLLLANEPARDAVLVVLVLVLAVLIARPRVQLGEGRWVTIGVAAALYLVAPLFAFGSAFLFGRFALLVFVGALMLLQPTRPSVAARVIVIAVVLIWIAVLSTRFHRFGLDAAGLDAAIDRIPAGNRVATVNLNPFSPDVPGPAFLHAGAWYQVRKGGVVGWSFSNYYPQVVRYRDGAEPVLRGGSIPRGALDWNGLRQFDYLIVRGADPRRALSDRPYPIRYLGRSGKWSLFQLPPGSRTPRNCTPFE